MTYNDFWEIVLPIMLIIAFTVPMNVAIAAIIDTVKKWGIRNHKDKEES